MFGKKKKQFSTLQLGLDVKRCADCGKHERPCLVDGEPAVFHRWVDEDRGLLRINAFVRPDEQAAMHRRFLDDGVIPDCCSVEALRCTFALVEYPDGSVGKVKPELVTFLDRKEG